MTNNIYDNISYIKDKFDIFLFDAYGVFWSGKEFYDGSKEIMEELIKEGKTVYILSNTTQTSEAAEKSYEKKGLIKGKEYNKIITSGEFAKYKLSKETKHKNVYIFGTENKSLFDENTYKIVYNLKEADLVYISIPQLTEEQFSNYEFKEILKESKLPKEGTPRKWDALKIDPFLPELQEIIKSKLPVINANPDLTAAEGVKGKDEINLVIRQGEIAQYLRQKDVKITEYGKPNKEIYEFVFEILQKDRLKINKDRILMIGDTLRTDILGAKNAGIKSCLCIKTGVTYNELNNNKNLNLEKLFTINKVEPDFLIKTVGFISTTKTEEMTEKFQLVPGLAKKAHVMDLRLSTVLFEDNEYYPWIFLVPMKPNVKNMLDLTIEERIQLMKEMACCEKVMAKLFEHDQTNVAMIGNKTPQLHVHILCRKEGDPDWPGTVWGNTKKPYETEEKKNAIIAKIKKAIEEEFIKPEYR